METLLVDANSDTPNDLFIVFSRKLFELINKLVDRLFFVFNIPTNTLQPRWYLV